MEYSDLLVSNIYLAEVQSRKKGSSLKQTNKIALMLTDNLFWFFFAPYVAQLSCKISRHTLTMQKGSTYAAMYFISRLVIKL